MYELSSVSCNTPNKYVSIRKTKAEIIDIISQKNILEIKWKGSIKKL